MKFKSAKNDKKKRISLKWKKVNGATKYKVKWVLEEKRQRRKPRALKEQRLHMRSRDLKKAKPIRCTFEPVIKAAGVSGVWLRK